MKKLCVDENYIKGFTVDGVKDFEGCPPALAYFKNMFGDKSYDMRQHKHLMTAVIVKYEKGEWIINYLLNLLKPKYRSEFFMKHLGLVIADEGEDFKNDVTQICNLFIKHCNPTTTSRSKKSIESILEPIDAEILKYADPDNMPEIDMLADWKQKRTIIEAVLFILEDENRNFTRSVTDGLMKLAEAKAYSDLVTYNYEDNLKAMALDLMEFTGIWQEN